MRLQVRRGGLLQRRLGLETLCHACVQQKVFYRCLGEPLSGGVLLVSRLAEVKAREATRLTKLVKVHCACTYCSVYINSSWSLMLQFKMGPMKNMPVP